MLWDFDVDAEQIQTNVQPGVVAAEAESSLKVGGADGSYQLELISNFIRKFPW